MKQLFKTKRGTITLADVPAPACGPGELLVETAWSLISAGTETKSLTQPPAVRAARRRSLLERGLQVLEADGLRALAHKIADQRNIGEALGYSAAGRVIAVGADVTGFAIGDRVACAGGGYASHAEIIRVPPMLAVKVPLGVPLQSACYATVGAIALQGIRRAAPQLGEVVVVTGVGLIGALTVQLLRAQGCRIVAVDPLRERRELAHRLGAERTVDAADPSALGEAVAAVSDGIGADVVLLCATTPSSEPMRRALEVVRQRGRVVVVGDVGMEVQRSPFYQKEAEITISCSYGPGRYDASYEQGGIDYPPGFARWTENRNLSAFLGLCASSALDVQALTTHTYPIEDGVSAYQQLVREPAATLGVLLRYPAAAEAAGTAPERTVRVGRSRRDSGRIGVAVLGVGGFAQSTHLPNLVASPHFDLRWAVAATGGSAVQKARAFGAAFASTDPREALSDPSVDAVVICTRHDTHAELTEAALRAGKHVLVEKPLGITEPEIDRIMEAHAGAGRVLTVGTNRRYSPAARAARAALAVWGGPIMVVCRINAGAIPASHWTQDRRVGGGRIIGEVCHFLDLCGYLVGDDVMVEKAQAAGIDPGRGPITALDNVSITLSYGDGSVATIVYAAVGAKEQPKELVEVMARGRSLVIDDFASLRGFGSGAPSIEAGRRDKGHARELDELARAIRGQPSELVSAESSAATARLAVRIDEALRGD